mmetsp:Transcript_7400/g.20905  ORF Transcript_7400/g.20905 Transcript_7400/m.20905 type:complete len:257 (-) Transcript_7400:322-1092(-)|eukprot:CAMPEP_0117663298 /NCGR_PEP_ID=MMETSP0804-20121206/8527_1 /TAXON_ID=1074897 /ORGANISM="Tetraselmis astigmatica, Strain CCMP880" /LENGTH=256 /DNA_ID=CAMNT_0005470285 /DNA_START=508 /DNA_END=1278 /DNA_ORIENTATION=-
MECTASVSAADELFALVDPFDGNCPTDQDFEAEVFDLLDGIDDPNWMLDFDTSDLPLGMTPLRERCGSNDNASTKSGGQEDAPKGGGVSTLVSADSNLTENCVAELPVHQMIKGEGQGENFVPKGLPPIQVVPKKRKRELDDENDAAMDAAAAQLEEALARLEQENKNLIGCFVTLGQQMQTMMAENQQMKQVLAICNKTLNGGSAHSNKQAKAGFAVSDRPSPHDSCQANARQEAAVSPTMQLLAQVALSALQGS